MANPLQAYKTISLETAPPGKLVLMLYEGAIRFLDKALIGMEMEDPLERIETVHNNVTRAQSIISELNYTLDMERGDKVAEVLRDLYLYFDNKLYRSNIHKDGNGIREVIEHINVLREGWSEMLEKDAVAC